MSEEQEPTNMSEKEKEEWVTRVQTTLSDIEVQGADNEWDGMPEFTNEKKEEYRKVTIRFENEADLQDFCKKINQQITPKTKQLWHPKKERDTLMRWVDDSNLKY